MTPTLLWMVVVGSTKCYGRQNNEPIDESLSLSLLVEQVSPLSRDLVGSFRGARLLFLWTLLKRVSINGVAVMSTLISKLMFVYTYITGPSVYSLMLSQYQFMSPPLPISVL